MLADLEVVVLMLVELHHVAVKLHLELVLLLLLEESGRHLLRNDPSPDVVLGEEAQPHLLQDQLDLLLPLHRAVGLDLQLLHDLGRLLRLAVRLVYLGEAMGQPRPLVLDVDLAGGDCPQGVDQLEHGGLVGRLVEEGDHLGHGLLQLGALLDQIDHPERGGGMSGNGMVPGILLVGETGT